MDFQLKCLVLCVAISFCAAQVNRPRISPQINLLSSFPGFSISNGTRESKVVIDLYIDLVCPDSAQAFPVLQEVVADYPPEDLAVYIHQLPLPYHRNGFLLAQGYFQVLEKAPDTVLDYVTMCFNNISTFRGSTNKEKSEWEFTGILAEMQEEVTGIPPLQFIQDIDDYAGIAVSHWKYGVRKGVAGTPWFFVNDVDLGVNPNDDVNLLTWKLLINILLRFQSQGLTEQEINLDDYLYNNNHHYNAKGASSTVEENSNVARQVSQYLKEILQKNYFPVHSKHAINNARKPPMYTP